MRSNINRTKVRASKFTTYLQVPDEGDLNELDKLTSHLETLLEIEGISNIMDGYQLTIYQSESLKSKLCGFCVQFLEDWFISGDISIVDIQTVYQGMDKSLPKKFSELLPPKTNNKLYDEIEKAIAPHAEDIKQRQQEHYERVIKKYIDHESSLHNKKDFINAAKRNLSSLELISMCVAYRFNNEKLTKLINESLEFLTAKACYRIHSSASQSDIDSGRIDIVSFRSGVSGFEIELYIGNTPFYLRAIEVEGACVSFHYRYIITNKFRD